MRYKTHVCVLIINLNVIAHAREHCSSQLKSVFHPPDIKKAYFLPIKCATNLTAQKSSIPSRLQFNFTINFSVSQGERR